MFKIASKRGKVKFLLIENKIIAPTNEPSVEKIIIPIIVKVVLVAKKPLKVKMISDGIGGKIFSIAISSKGLSSQNVQ